MAPDTTAAAAPIAVEWSSDTESEPPPPVLPVFVVYDVSDYLTPWERAVVPLVCRAWCDALSEEHRWQEAFEQSYGALASTILAVESSLGGRRGWWARKLFADAWVRDGYAVLVAIDDLVDSKWIRYAFAETDTVVYGHSLLAKLKLLGRGGGGEEQLPGYTYVREALEGVLELLPFTGFWSLCSLNLTKIEAAYIPAIKDVRLDSMKEIHSEILIALQKCITNVVLRMEGETRIGFNDEALQMKSFRELIDIGVHKHVAAVDMAHRELTDTIQPLTWLTDIMSHSLLVPVGECIAPDSSINYGRMAQFCGILTDIRARLAPTLDAALGFVSRPFDDDLVRVIAFIDQLARASRILDSSKQYYATPFVRTHYATHNTEFEALWARYRGWLAGYCERASMYDFCYFAERSRELGAIVDKIADLDRRHVAQSVCTTLPEALFFDYQQIRRDLLTAETIERVPERFITALLPFCPGRPLRFSTSDVADDVDTGYDSPVREIALHDPDVAFETPLYVSTTSTPLPRGADTQKWTITGMVDYDARGRGFAACGCPEHNTAPLWMGRVAGKLKRQAHIAITAKLPYTELATSDDLETHAYTHQPVLVEIAVGLFCSHRIALAVGDDDPLAALAAFRNTATALRAEAVARHVATRRTRCPAAPVFTYYVDALDTMLRAPAPDAASINEAWSQCLQFTVTKSQLGDNFNTLNLHSGVNAGHYGFSVLQNPQGTFYTTRLEAVERIVAAVCTPSDPDAPAPAQATMPCLYFQRQGGRHGPVALELLLGGLSASLGRSVCTVECKDLTEEAVVRYVAACSASGWLVVLKGINNTPAHLTSLLAKTVESLLVSERNQWDTVGDWQNWPLREMPISKSLGYSTNGVAIATLEEGDGSAYVEDDTPQDDTQMEAYLPWELQHQLDMRWVPNESPAGYVTAHMHVHNILLDRREIDALYETVHALIDAAGPCPRSRSELSCSRLSRSQSMADSQRSRAPHPRSTTLSYLQLFCRLTTDTHVFVERLAALAGDFVYAAPACLSQLPPDRVEHELPQTGGAAPLFIALGLFLESLMDANEYHTFCTMMRDNLAKHGSPQTFPVPSFNDLRGAVRGAMERQGYDPKPPLEHGGLALLVTSRFYAVSMVITSTPQQDFTQGLATLVKQVPHLSCGFFTILLEGELAGGNFREAMWRALKESHEKAGDASGAGCWILLRLTQRTMCNAEVMAQLVEVARTQRVVVPPPSKKGKAAAAGASAAARGDGPTRYLHFGTSVKLLLVVDRQYRALERLLPFVAPVQLSFGERDFVLQWDENNSPSSAASQQV